MTVRQRREMRGSHVDDAARSIERQRRVDQSELRDQLCEAIKQRLRAEGRLSE